MRLYTIGHSTRTWEELLDLLRAHRIRVLVDVRSWPVSGRFPHFDRERLEESLAGAGIEYVWIGDSLGGYRKEGLGKSSPNTWWESEGFRNYADHMRTPPFKQGVDCLLRVAGKGSTAIMCAERFYWRCHRRLISDYLKAQGHEVTHVVDRDNTREHKLAECIHIIDGDLLYVKDSPGSHSRLGRLKP